MDATSQLKYQLQNLVQWLRSQSKKQVHLGYRQTLEYMELYGDQIVPILPKGTTSIVMAKPGIIRRARFDDWKRKAVEFVFRREFTPDIAHSRCHRAVRSRLEEGVAGEITIWDLTVKQEHRPQEIGSYGVEERRLYKYLSPWDRTSQAIDKICSRQPGGFMIIPCILGEQLHDVYPREVAERIGAGQFGLTAYMLTYYRLVYFREFDGLGPIGCLGDRLFIPNDSKHPRSDESDGLRQYHFLQMTEKSPYIRYECLRSDEVASFIPAIGMIPPVIGNQGT